MAVRSLRGRKDSYYESTTAVHICALFRCLAPLMRLKRAKNCPRRGAGNSMPRFMMPNIDGLEVCRSLKSDPETAGIRVVAMTGYHSPELEKKMLAEGAHVLLRKPFPSEVVVRECGFAELTTLPSEIA